MKLFSPSVGVWMCRYPVCTHVCADVWRLELPFSVTLHCISFPRLRHLPWKLELTGWLDCMVSGPQASCLCLSTFGIAMFDVGTAF